MKLLRDMTEPELKGYFTRLARIIEAALPPGPSSNGKCLFCLIVADSLKPGIGQYLSNINRQDAIKMIRQLADQIEAHEDIPR